MAFSRLTFTILILAVQSTIRYFSIADRQNITQNHSLFKLANRQFPTTRNTNVKVVKFRRNASKTESQQY